MAGWKAEEGYFPTDVCFQRPYFLNLRVLKLTLLFWSQARYQVTSKGRLKAGREASRLMDT